ncbi:MAG: hypothetical protein IKP64_00025 [Selenomonadaceae bacterium]|nr:hypothetical protein [Selenomonadaceae bacterium]MBR4381921.1 hypothetical protein [Selenomonadaceae bacterium]
MTQFYLAVCKNKFYVYDDARKPVYIEGEPFFAYEVNKIRTAVAKLREQISDEYNLDKNEITFRVVANSDKVRNESLSKELGAAIVKTYKLDELIRKTLTEFAKNPKLYINEFGLNYDGESYRFDNNLLIYDDFSLLALSIEPSELLNFVD